MDEIEEKNKEALRLLAEANLSMSKEQENKLRNTSSGIDDLNKQLENLHEKIKNLESESWKINYGPQNISSAVDKALAESGVIKIGRWVVIGFLVLGTVMWIGGSIYSGIQIKSMEERAKSVNEQIDNIEKRINTTLMDLVTKETDKISESVKQAKTNITGKENEITAAADKASTYISSKGKEIDTALSTAKTNITGKENEITAAVSTAKTNITGKENEITAATNKITGNISEAIEKEKTRAFRKLDVDSLPDFTVLRQQIEELKKTGGEVNIWNARYFFGVSWWVMTIVLLLLILLSITNFFLYRRVCRNIYGRM